MSAIGRVFVACAIALCAGLVVHDSLSKGRFQIVSSKRRGGSSQTPVLVDRSRQPTLFWLLTTTTAIVCVVSLGVGVRSWTQITTDKGWSSA